MDQSGMKVLTGYLARGNKDPNGLSYISYLCHFFTALPCIQDDHTPPQGVCLCLALTYCTPPR